MYLEYVLPGRMTRKLYLGYVLLGKNVLYSLKNDLLMKNLGKSLYLFDLLIFVSVNL